VISLRLAAATTLTLLLTVGSAGVARGQPAHADTCAIYANHGAFGGTQGVAVSGRCVPAPQLSGGGQPAPETRTLFCGRQSQVRGGPVTAWDARCGAPQQCYRPDPASGQPHPVDAFATQTRVTGGWTRPTVWCPASPAPALTLAGIRAHALRLLPHVPIGVAPADAITLVNIQTLLWADTGTDRTLPSVRIVGRRVGLRIHLTGAHWDFGDHTSDTSPDPGRPYDEQRHPCRSLTCPGYYGHIYRHTGTPTLTLTLTWHAQYDTGAGWTDLPDPPLTGPASTRHLTVKQARAVLVPNPDDH
jgi:hypothetical protein